MGEGVVKSSSSRRRRRLELMFGAAGLSAPPLRSSRTSGAGGKVQPVLPQRDPGFQGCSNPRREVLGRSRGAVEVIPGARRLSRSEGAGGTLGPACWPPSTPPSQPPPRSPESFRQMNRIVATARGSSSLCVNTAWARRHGSAVIYGANLPPSPPG